MKNLFSLFVAVAVLFLTGVFANAQDFLMFGVATPVEDVVDRVETPVVIETILYAIDPQNGDSTEIGPTGFNRCSSLDFEPLTNELFGVCLRLEEEPMAEVEVKKVGEVLVNFDILTGQGTEVGLLNMNGDKSGRVTDISFRSDGTLFAHVIDVNGGLEEKVELSMKSEGYLGMIDTKSGLLTFIGPTGFDEAFSAIGFSLQDNLYHGADNGTMGALNMLNQTTGNATLLANLAYPPMFMGGNIITTMDIDPASGDLIAVLFSEEENGTESIQTREPVTPGFFLIQIDPTDGGIILRGETQDQLAAIAVYRPIVREVPTLSEYGLIVTFVLLLGAAVVFLRRRQVKTAV